MELLVAIPTEFHLFSQSHGDTEQPSAATKSVPLALPVLLFTIKNRSLPSSAGRHWRSQWHTKNLLLKQVSTMLPHRDGTNSHHQLRTMPSFISSLPTLRTELHFAYQVSEPRSPCPPDLVFIAIFISVSPWLREKPLLRQNKDRMIGGTLPGIRFI